MRDEEVFGGELPIMDNVDEWMENFLQSGDTTVPLEKLMEEGEVGSQVLEKSLVPAVDDIFLSMMVGLRGENDPSRIVWKYVISGRNNRIRRPFHVSWALLRRLAYANTIVRQCINFIVQEFRTVDWTIQAREREYTTLAQLASYIFRFPSPQDTFLTMKEKILNDLLILDAACVEVWRGKLIPFKLSLEREKIRRLEKFVKNNRGITSDLVERYEGIYRSSLLRYRYLERILNERMKEFQKVLSGDERLVLEVSFDEAEKLEKAVTEKFRGIHPEKFLEMDFFLHDFVSSLPESYTLIKQLGRETKTLDIPLVFLPIPGDQIEIAGDMDYAMMDLEFPYRRVLFDIPIQAYKEDELIYLKENNRTDSFYGIPPTESVLIVAYAFLIAHDVQFRYFTRTNIPAGILTVPGPTNVNSIRQELRRQLASPERLVVLQHPPGATPTFIRLSDTNRDIQFLELLDWYSRLIFLCFGLQPWEVGLQQGTISRRQLRIRPGIIGRLKFLQYAYNDLFLIKAFKLNPTSMFFKWIGADVGDFADEASAVNNLLFRVMSLDEARERLGLPPIDAGLSSYLFLPTGTGVFIIGKVRKTADEPIVAEEPEQAVGVWTTVAGGLAAGGGGMGGLGGLGGLGGGEIIMRQMERLKKELPRWEESERELKKLSEKEQGGIISFGRALQRLGVVSDPKDGVSLALKVRDLLRKEYKREVRFNEWASALGTILRSIYETQLQDELKKIVNDTVSLEDILKGD
ncbi:MAG: hypothetical protein QW815_00475 [Nitrososphaerota archaeon]